MNSGGIGDSSSDREGMSSSLSSTDGFVSDCKLLCEHLNQHKAKLIYKNAAINHEGPAK